MAEFYVDTSAVGNEYQAYADTPASWAVPQDGNGKAGPGHAAATPVVEVTFAAVPTTGTISVYGATVTLTGVLSAASTSAAATALVSSINATTTALGPTVSALLLPLNRFVFARVKPGDSSAVQIMSRFAGADLNFSGNAAARVVNTFNNTAMTSPVDFAGGADGPWAYLFNTTTVFGKATIGTYGVYWNASSTPSNPTASDCVHVRTRRSGVDLSMAVTFATAPTLAWVARSYLYDDGSVWTGDNGQLSLAFTYSQNGSATCRFTLATDLLHASRGMYNFKVSGASTGSLNARFAFVGATTGSSFGFVNSVFAEGAGNVPVLAVSTSLVDDTGTNQALVQVDLSNSLFQFNATAKSMIVMVGTSSGSTALSGFGTRIITNGAKVQVTAATGPIGPAITINGTGAQAFIQWIGGEIFDTNGVYRCVNPLSVAGAISNIVAVVDGVLGVTDPAIGFTYRSSGACQFMWNQPEGPNKGFRFETSQYTVDWKGDNTFPYAGGAADLRGVNWSHRVTWTTAPDRFFAVPVMRFGYFNRAAAAIRTIRLDLYTPDASVIYADELELTVSYMDSSDVWRNERAPGISRALQGSASRTALATGVASWTLNGVSGYSAKQISLVTAYPVKSSSEISMSLSLVGYRASAIVFYVSPEPVVT